MHVKVSEWSVPSLRVSNNTKTLKVAFRGGLGGGMAEAEAPEQRDMKLRKCFFGKIFVSTNPSYILCFIFDNQPGWFTCLLGMFPILRSFREFGWSPKWQSGRQNPLQSVINIIWNQSEPQGKKITSWEDHCRLCTASAWQFGCPLCTPTSRPNYLQCHSQQLIRDWKIKVMLACCVSYDP